MLQRRTEIYLSLKMSPFDVCFLQECHLQDKDAVSVFFLQSGKWGLHGGGWEMLGQMGWVFYFFYWEFVIESANVIIPGRIVVADVRWRGLAFRFVKVYAPSKLGDREGFLDSLALVLYTNRFLVLGGDFNMSLDNASVKALVHLVTGFSLRDAFWGAGGWEPTYTCRSSKQEASRLDYLFLPVHVRVCDYTQLPMWCSDHCLVGVRVDVGGMKRVRGVWSFLKKRAFCVALYNLVAGWKKPAGLV